MAYKDFEGLSLDGNAHITLDARGEQVDLPDASYVRDATISRDGLDLVLDGPNGELIIKDYFAGDTPPDLVAPGGATLTPTLVQSFIQSSPEHAGVSILNDESPVGQVAEVTGLATVRHPDGSTETIAKGTPIYKGDIVETDAKGAVNITFADETNFAVSEDARFAVDDYTYDPQTQSGETNFSVLKGVFVFTSGLIGRDDPDDVKIETPAGSIGIRGTIIAGNVNTGEITVVEGAIVLTDRNGHEMTLATQFETARFHNGEGIENIGQLSAKDVSHKFFVVSQVSPTLFSSINDAAVEQGKNAAQPAAEAPIKEGESPIEEMPADAPAQDIPATESNGHSAAPGDSQSTATVAALPPVPPPVASFNSPGFTAPTGLNPQTAFSTFSNTLTTDSAILGTTSGSTGSGFALDPINNIAPLHTPPPPSVSTTAKNNAPFFIGEAPGAFFHSSENQVWRYRFDKEFHDDGGQGNITYGLSDATISSLNNMMVGGSTGNNLIVAAGWTFNSSTGEMELHFNNAFSAPILSNFTIEVQATDSGGLSSAYQNFAFTAHNATSTTMPASLTASNVVVSTLTPATAQISGSNNDIFLGSGNDTITANGGTGNEIWLGDGRNTLTFQSPARSNQGVGGSGRDVFNLKNAALNLFGMDGDDDFVLFLSSGSTVIADLQTSLNSTIDGGHSNFRAGLVLNTSGVNTVAGEAGGRGDSLVLEGAGTLNFSTINSTNKIYSIERIDAANSVDAQTMILNYNDVLRLTDDKDTLIINIADGDQLTLSGMTGMTKVLDNVAIDDAANGNATSMRNYDVFTDGNVTILISATGAAATSGVTMDGTTVAI